MKTYLHVTVPHSLHPSSTGILPALDGVFGCSPGSAKSVIGILEYGDSLWLARVGNPIVKMVL